MSEQNKSIVRAIYEVINTGNFSKVDQLIAADAVDHEAPPGAPPGPAVLKEFVTTFRAAFPDLKISAEDMIADGDKVAARAVMRGTHKGEFMGVPATGKQFEIAGIDIIRFAGGKVVEHWGITDTLGLMQQLGAMPS
jgi:steroid delta-isomerase-like uncharacterized protein